MRVTSQLREPTLPKGAPVCAGNHSHPRCEVPLGGARGQVDLNAPLKNRCQRKSFRAVICRRQLGRPTRTITRFALNGWNLRLAPLHLKRRLTVSDRIECGGSLILLGSERSSAVSSTSARPPLQRCAVRRLGRLHRARTKSGIGLTPSARPGRRIRRNWPARTSPSIAAPSSRLDLRRTGRGCRLRRSG